MTHDHDSDQNRTGEAICEVPEDFLQPRDLGLEGRAALPPVNTPLPLPSDGLYGYYDASKRYGVRDAIASLVEAGRIWKLRAKLPDVGIGDISKLGGGQIPDHASHRKGIDVDIRPLQRNGQVGPVTYHDPSYSWELSQELADIIHANGKLAVQFILFNDPNVHGVQHYQNHDNHLHVRFLPPGAAAPLPVLQQGSRHATVRELQRRVNFWIGSARRGSTAPLQIDGAFGSATQAAVSAFQGWAGLTPNGIAGVGTWQRLPLAPGVGANT